MATANLLQTSVSGGTQNALSLQGDGVFFPKASTTSRLALTLTTTDKGFIVYDTTDNNIYFWNGAAWESIPGSGDAGANGSVQYNDNGIVSGATNFVWDKVNSRVGIGTATTAEKLTIDNNLGGAAVGLRVYANDQSTARIAIQNTNGQAWHLVAGYAGANNQGLSIFDSTTNANRLYLDTSGNANIINGNLILGTSGKGIDFSATPGTGTSELLNDYEEGNWTPVATGLTNVGAVTYIATYTKIGRVVYINLKVTAVTSTTSVANTTFFSGLPFTPAQNSTITAVNEGNITSLGVGLIATGSTVFTPNWTAVQNATISGFYYV